MSLLLRYPEQFDAGRPEPCLRKTTKVSSALRRTGVYTDMDSSATVPWQPTGSAVERLPPGAARPRPRRSDRCPSRVHPRGRPRAAGRRLVVDVAVPALP